MAVGTDLAHIQATLARLTKAMEGALRDHSRTGDAPFTTESAESALPGQAPERLTVALAWTHALARRDRVFGPDLFSDPAWHILLNLYIARCRRSDLCVSAVCTASGVAMTTALRCIAVLTERRLVERHADPFDKRRSLLRLSSDGAQKVEQALDQATESDRNLGLGRLRLIKRSA